MVESSPPKEYRPILIPRRGEIVAWVSTLMVVATIVVLTLMDLEINWLMWLLVFLLLPSALLISLSNWVDRHTILRIDPASIEFNNGLRNTRLRWEQITGLRIQPAEWGKRVQVIGESASFTFRTLGEVHLRGKLQGRMGFEQGEEILQQVVSNSGLSVTSRNGEERYLTRS